MSGSILTFWEITEGELTEGTGELCDFCPVMPLLYWVVRCIRADNKNSMDFLLRY